MEMGRPPASDSRTPSNNERCIKNDGKLWRCGSWRMEGKSICNRHFLKQLQYQNKKKNLPPQHYPKNKRKARLEDEDSDDAKKKKRKKEDSDDDSLEKLFDGYPSEEDKDDSIEKLFEDNWTSESDGDSCQPTSKASAMSTCAQEEPVEELKKNQEETPTHSAR